MTKQASKRYKKAKEQISSAMEVDAALRVILEQPGVKFVESVDADIHLGIDPRKSDQQVRGTCQLPHGSGKPVRVAVFAKGEEADAARDAGADLVGDDDLVAQVEEGKIDFDRCIASPKMMGQVGRLGRVLGPRNLMPNPKLGTVTTRIAEAVKSAKGGAVQLRADKGGSVHTTIGRKNFTSEQLKDNLHSVLRSLDQLKPSGQKGRYLRKVSLSSTMSPGVAVELSSLEGVK